MSEDRFVALDGCFNFRDLGGRTTTDGRRVRRGRVFRSDSLHHLSPRDVERLRGEVGLREVLDLRSAAETEIAPEALLAPPVAYRRIPLFERSGASEGRIELSLDLLYFGMMQLARARIAEVVERIANAPGPTVFHCAAGKDRTGIVAAVLLGAVGVPDAEVIEDYADTRRSLGRIVERLRTTAGYEYVFTELPPETLHAEPDTMARLLGHVRGRHGSIRGYLAEAGVPDATLVRLEAALLED